MQVNITNTDWIFNLKEEVPGFLAKLKGKEIPGFYHYSLSGDLYDENIGWGLGNAVFAAKIYYTLDMVDSLAGAEITGITGFIKGFQKEDGSIFDPLISSKVSVTNRLQAVMKLDFSEFRGTKTRRAETRQSFSALQLLNARPDLPYSGIPVDHLGINKYLGSLDWSKPYAAGSHFSHLLYFLHINNLMFGIGKESSDELIDYAISWINKLQLPEDGGWYRGQNITLSQKINGAMKIITGLKAVDKPTFKYPEKLIDLCLLATSLEQACDNLDVIYVIHSANELTKASYRYQDMQDFCIRWLGTCREHYFPDIGGFSFFQHRANQYYYGAKITRGLNEPDIHGTVLLLWGIALVSRILGIDKELRFKEYIA